nr:beta-catenin-like protein 1 [Ipomoea trifida]
MHRNYSNFLKDLRMSSRIVVPIRRGWQMNEVDAILQAVVAYKSKNPKTADKEELVENLFDSLCCLLMPLETKERFVKSEGVELMIIIMNQKKLCYGSTIRALDFAMINYPPSCVMDS